MRMARVHASGGDEHKSKESCSNLINPVMLSVSKTFATTRNETTTGYRHPVATVVQTRVHIHPQKPNQRRPRRLSGT